MTAPLYDPHIHSLRKYRPQWLILITWFLVNGILLTRNGIITGGESLKYIRQAEIFLKNGALGTPNFKLYLVQILLLAGSLKSGLGFTAVIIVQLAVNLWSVFSFYRLIRFIFENENLAITGSILLLINLPYQEFNTMLQTESLFFSFTVIYSSYLLRTIQWGWRRMAGVILWLIIISLTRPTGLLMLPPTIAYVFISFAGNWKRWEKISVALGLSVLFLFLLDWALGLGGELDFSLPFRTSQVICGVPGDSGKAEISFSSDPNSVFGLVYYITHNFGQFIRLAWMKTVAFFGLQRSYYSTMHNACLAIFYYTLQVAALTSIPCWIRLRPNRLTFLLSFILMNWMTVVFTCDDWHNRFFLTISPWLILMSLGLSDLFTGKEKPASIQGR